MELYSLENPNLSFNFYDDFSLDHFDYVLDGLLTYEDGFGGVVGEDQFSCSSYPSTASPPEQLASEVDNGASSSSTNGNMNVRRNGGSKNTGDADLKPQKVAFKTKSKHDVLDDGYRWRKYGKKPIKNNPNLRNYYKCTSGGCQVRKIVERWIEDSSFVITQYVGVHTHGCPSPYSSGP